MKKIFLFLLILILIVLSFMTLTYATIIPWAGNTFTGNSTDTKPANAPNGSRFVDMDNLLWWVKVNGVWRQLGGSLSSLANITGVIALSNCSSGNIAAAQALGFNANSIICVSFSGASRTLGGVVLTSTANGLSLSSSGGGSSNVTLSNAALAIAANLPTIGANGSLSLGPANMISAANAVTPGSSSSNNRTLTGVMLASAAGNMTISGVGNNTLTGASLTAAASAVTTTSTSSGCAGGAVFCDDFSGTLAQWQGIANITIVSGAAQAPSTTVQSAMWGISGVTFTNSMIVKATINEGSLPGAGQYNQWELCLAGASNTGSYTYRANTECVRVYVDGDAGTTLVQARHFNSSNSATSSTFNGALANPTFPTTLEMRWVSSTTYQCWINGVQIGGTSTAKTATYGSTVYPSVYMGFDPSYLAEVKSSALTIDDFSVTP